MNGTKAKSGIPPQAGNISALPLPPIHMEIQRNEKSEISQANKANDIINRRNIEIITVDIFVLIRDVSLERIFFKINSQLQQQLQLSVFQGALGMLVHAGAENSCLRKTLGSQV